MKRFLVALPFLIFLSCQRPQPMDDMFPWPASGIAEADSLVLLFERQRAYKDILDYSHEPAGKLCSIARLDPDNKMLQVRKVYMEACAMQQHEREGVVRLVDSAMKISRAHKFDYDWHMLNSLRAEYEKDLAKRYESVLGNIEFFGRHGAEPEKARNLVLMGNIMYDISDSVKALGYFREAEEICTRLGMTNARSICRLNIALVSSLEQRDSIFGKMVDDPDVKNDPRAYALVLQDYFIINDSLPLIELAVKMLKDNDIERNNLPVALALKGHWHVRHDNPRLGVGIIREAFESIRDYNIEIESRYLQTMHSFMADAYYFAGEKDSCIEELDRARILNDRIAEERNGAGVYASDVKARIRMAEDNARLNRWRMMTLWIISLLAVGMVGTMLLFRFKRKVLKQQFEARLLEEKLERNRQSVRAQASVMEEGDRMIGELGKKIDEMKVNLEISSDCADKLSRFLKMYKGNEENRQGFLLLNKEIDTRFAVRLKSDFPTLTENQLRLASLIAAGVDSRQVCAIMNIEQASVHKSRYRLRSRLGLSKEASLEAFLRRYNSNHSG